LTRNTIHPGRNPTSPRPANVILFPLQPYLLVTLFPVNVLLNLTFAPPPIAVRPCPLLSCDVASILYFFFAFQSPDTPPHSVDHFVSACTPRSLSSPPPMEFEPNLPYATLCYYPSNSPPYLLAFWTKRPTPIPWSRALFCP